MAVPNNTAGGEESKERKESRREGYPRRGFIHEHPPCVFRVGALRAKQGLTIE